MKFYYLTIALIATLTSCDQPTATSAGDAEHLSAAGPEPTTDRGIHVDTYFGTDVPDPYRWLEDDLSDDTSAWISQQNTSTRSFIDAISLRDDVKKTVARLLNFERETAPFFEGGTRYFYRNSGLQNQRVLFRETEDLAEQVFLDPNTFSDDGTVSMSGVSFSKDGSLVAYQLSEGGSDWRSIVIRDVETGVVLEPPLVDVKFSGIEWMSNTGFFYSSYDKPDGSELSAKTDQHKLYFHRLGTPQSSDELVFGGSNEEKHRYVGADVGADGRYLVISAANSTSGNRLFVKDLSSDNDQLIVLFADESADGSLLESDDNLLLIETNKDAPNGRVIAVDPQLPDPGQWIDVIPEGEFVLNASSGAGFLFAEYMVDAISRVTQFDLKGRMVRNIELPDLGTASGFGGEKDQEALYFTFTNYRIAPAIFALDPKRGETTLYRASQSPFDGNRFKT